LYDFKKISLKLLSLQLLNKNKMDNLKQEIFEILTKYSFNKELIKSATEESNITKDLKINSARIVDIVLDVEEKYDIEINDEELENIQTIKDMLNIINSKSK